MTPKAPPAHTKDAHSAALPAKAAATPADAAPQRPPTTKPHSIMVSEIPKFACHEIYNQPTWVSIYIYTRIYNLVGGFNPFEKYSSNWFTSPSRGENKKCLKPPPSNTLYMNRNQGSGDTVQDDLLFIKLKTINGMIATYIYLVH